MVAYVYQKIFAVLVNPKPSYLKEFQLSNIFNYLITRLIFGLIFSFQPIESSAQSRQFKFAGYIYEYNTSIPVVNALLQINNMEIYSNDVGYFETSLSAGKYSLSISHLSFDTLFQSMVIDRDINLPFYLRMQSTAMREVTISGKSRKKHIEIIAPNAQTLTKADLELLPSFLGQKDPIKALQTLPGTGKGGEGNSGFYVRGGTSGQNLTLFNDATIYNPSHLLGFFSIFNSGAVDNINLYKSGIPAEYGGRLSSIIEVNSSKKIPDSASAEVNLSFLSASANVNIPINPNWSISTSARKTFMNYTIWPLANTFMSTSSSFDNLKYDFHDLNFSSNARIGLNNFLHFSAYTGSDDFGFKLRKVGIQNTMDWQNAAYSFSWKTIINNALVLNNTVTYSGYKFNFGMQQDALQAEISSRIKDYNLKSILSIYLDNHNLKTGFQFTHHYLKPNTPLIKSVDSNYDLGIPNRYYSDESAIFLSDEFNISEKLGAYAGARLTYYRHMGPYTRVNDDESTTAYDKNSLVSSFLYLDPSLTLRYLISQKSSFKLSFSKNIQPMHLISVTAINFPADFWMPSLSKLSPEKGLQASAGYFLNIGSAYETYIDLYYKRMNGLVEFSGGVMNLIDNLKIEDHLLYGEGNAYGSELFLKKKTGKVTGWIGYTLSKSTRDFELINNAHTFPAKYDRRHDLSIVSNYLVNKKWSLSGSFTYATGNAYTKPVSRYMIAGNIVNEYGSFNGARMPAYHRMDIAATYKIKSNKQSSSELSFSIYNIYNRKNPIYFYFLADGDLEKQQIKIEPKSVSILPVLPSINYRLIFR